MGKRPKPRPLEPEIPEQESTPATTEAPGCLPPVYAGLCRRCPPLTLDGGIARRDKGGLSALTGCGTAVATRPVVPQAENPDGITEGMMVHLRENIQEIVRNSGSCQWVPKMADFVYSSTVGDVQLIDTDHCLCRFGAEEFWLPCAACDAICCGMSSAGPIGPFATQTGTVPEVSEGITLLLRPDARDIVCASPFQWLPQMEALAGGEERGVLLRLHRGHGAVARVRFGGYLWSLPLRGLQTDPASPRRRGSLLVACSPPCSYSGIYSAACAKQGCRPNSQLAKLFTLPSVTLIDLSRNYLGPKGIKCLAAVLSANHSVSELVLSGAALTNGCVKTIAESLRTDRVVKRLDLSQNDISYGAGRKLLWLLQSNSAIVDIDLKETRVQETLREEIGAQCAANRHDRQQ